MAILFLNGKIDLFFCEIYISDNCNGLPIYCADGSYNKVKISTALNGSIQKVIGDFDSVIQEDSNLFSIDNDQETTDFEKSLNYMIEQGIEKAYVFGASEGEMDHFLGNVSIAKSYKNKIDIEFIDMYSRYFFIPKQYSVEGVLDRMISVMPFGEAENVCLTGLKYPLNRENLGLGYKVGIRNFAVDDVIDISYTSGDILLFVSHMKYKDR